MNNEIEERIKALVVRMTTCDPAKLTLDTTLCGDLGVAGIDGWELIVAFGQEFEVDLTGFDSMKHFGSEGGCNPFTPLIWLIEEILLKRETHEVWELVPVTIRDLVEAAEAKRWLK